MYSEAFFPYFPAMIGEKYFFQADVAFHECF